MKLPAIVGAALITAASLTEGQEERARDAEDFERSIRPILIRRCFECHGPESKAKGGLRVDSRAALLKGGDTGPALKPGVPEQSLMIDAVRHRGDVRMPPRGTLPENEISALERWIKGGAPWPVTPTAPQQQGVHWAFRPLLQSVIPSGRMKSPVDRFLQVRRASAGLEPSPAADRTTLIRRATFDLHGLPPAPEEVDAFLADESPKAFERVVDRLLASPRYGERWGRRWLDVARYADSNGGDRNLVLAHAYRYRDYVIRSFNDDKPYDRFVVEQLAGDLLPAPDIRTRNEHWIATGFLAIGPKPILKNDDALTEMDVVDEQIDTVGRAFLGLTIGCSRCHDHKFDPLPTADYYALAGIFRSTRSIDRYDLKVERAWTERALGTDEDEAEHLRLKFGIERADDMRRLTDDQAKAREYDQERGRLRKEAAKIPVAVAVREGAASDCAVHLRGDPQTLGELVPRGFPRALGGGPVATLCGDRSGRLELARWIASPDHPLTARVMVNRLWKGHFGEGIVRSIDNFGRLGQPPDHPELLDWLSRQFVEDGWSIKRMHRRLMLTDAYAMSSRPQEKAAVADPENRLLWRFPPRRLEAEEIRDALLAAGGRLNLTEGWPAVPPVTNYEPLEKGHIRKMIEDAYLTDRRSVYLPVIRSGLYDLFRVFDFADPSVSSGRREASTVASQALFMMNSDLVRRASASFAARVRREGGNEEDRVRRAYRLAFGRPPSETEVRESLEFLDRYAAAVPEREEAARARAWGGLCRAILSSNEFIFIE